MRNTLIACLIVWALTSLYYTNETAHSFIQKYAAKVGINLGNAITGTSVCPKDMYCVPKESPTP